jgi:hypothetical protein
MFFFRSTDPNDPRRGMNRDEDRRVLDEPHGTLFEAGYTRLSRADRETGVRSPVGSAPETFGRFVPD